MDITRESFGGVAIVSPRGRLTAAAAEILEPVLLTAIEENLGPLLIDCGELEYLSSVGLRLFYTVIRKFPGERRLSFCGATKNVRMIFQMVDLQRDFPIYSTRQEALEALARFSGPV